MALSYGFYNSVGGDRTYDAIQFGQIFDGIIKDGIYATYEKAMVVIASENAGEVIIQPGRAWFNHTWSYNDANYVMAAPEPDVLLERIDALVLDVNTELAFRENSFKWVEGTASSRPERPTLTNTVTHHQYPLCYVHRYPETTMIYTRDITNAVGTSETPFVTGVLTGLDIDMWINQWDDEFHTWETNTRTQFESWMINQQEVYTAWFNSVRSQMEDNMTEFEAWFETIQGIIDEEAATHLQAEIDALAEMLPAGSHIDIHTTESTLYNRNVTVSDQAGHSKTVKFGATGDATVESFPYVGLLDFVSTDGVRTASSSITTPYFGRYSVTMAFWAATCNLVSDESFAGIVVTVKDSLGDVKGAVTLDQYGSGAYTATYPDEYTFTLTYGGQTMEVSLAVTQETTYEVELHGGFRFDIWLEAGRVEEEFDTLDEVLADEKTLRQLFLVHDSVDYICDTFSGSATSALADITKIFNTDLAAKWINLSDYALDHFYAVSGIKSIMDTADKYGYGEWALMPQVPKMTSNTAPYGTIYSSSIESGFAAYYSFDGNLSTAVRFASGVTNNYITYEFTEPKNIKSFRMYGYVGPYCPVNSKPFIIQGSNDNINWTDLYSGNIEKADIIEIYDEINNDAYYSFYRVFCPEVMFGTNWAAGWFELQYYAWAPKGNVPVMTGNSAPYGEAIVTSQQTNYEAYRVFDRNYATKVAMNSAGISAYVGYKFTNPINVRRAYVYTDITDRDLTYQVQYSDDNSTWTDASEVIEMRRDNIANIDVADSGYHLYWRIVRTVINGGTAIMGICSELQFYGRELKVSVPTMTSNTAPYGEAIGGGLASQYNFPWKAFLGSPVGTAITGHPYVAPPNQNGYVGYLFNEEYAFKKAIVAIKTGSNSTTGTVSCKLQYTNDRGTTWVDIENANVSDTSAPGNFTQNNVHTLDIDVIGNGIRAVDTTTTNHNLDIGQLQFYGLDYSEKEFEEGTTKKWLYDHGVELKTMTINSGTTGVITKNDDNVLIKSNSAQSTTGQIVPQAYFEALDVTPYNLMRSKHGKQCVAGQNIYYAGRVSSTAPIKTGDTSLANVLFNTLNADGEYLNITSINQQAYIVLYNNTAGSACEVTELWLE